MRKQKSLMEKKVKQAFEDTSFKIYRNRTDKIIHQSVNEEQALERLSQPLPRMKSKAMVAITKKLQFTNKPVCTSYGIINPVKLDISNLKRA